MRLTSAGKMTISTVITNSTTGNQSMKTDYATQQSGRTGHGSFAALIAHGKVSSVPVF
jgi:hypothetical protein